MAVFNTFKHVLILRVSGTEEARKQDGDVYMETFVLVKPEYDEVVLMTGSKHAF